MKKKSLLTSIAVAAAAVLVLAGCSAKSDNKTASSSSSSAKTEMMSSTSMSGTFAGMNGKNVSGNVTVENGEIKLSNFKTDEGPDLHVYLAKDGDVKSGAVDAKIDLKAENQTIKIPEGVDASKYNSVLIYCDKAHVTFGEAKLTSQMLKGSFTGMNDKKVSGTVTVANNKITLDNFKTDEGPDLHIYLAKDGDVKSGIIDAKISLTEGKQEFDIPAGTDLSKYNSVLIYCDKAHVTFGEAKLA
ncbi:DM13 domain-containing protein [Lactococcus termiticola]|uniref:DM13 domain-containing protein n=1 Tax=Lactococcus termiticola TaxID=2169526 RepID=A0A2R5HHH5_9LACT|nr:DM13 domain-containing protein [Lactococcus termiticola]GBG97306.1 hypothetical protein NtB2_01445 [Lactococcus termiticola]